MARPASIWQRKQTGDYYVTFKGEKVRLSKDRAEAERMFHELMATKGIAATPEPARQLGPTFKRLADLYLTDTEGKKGDSVFAHQKGVLQSFCDHAKRLRAAELRGHHVTAWLATKKTWNPSTRSLAIKAIKACCNWGTKQGLLESHPLKGYSSGKARRRRRVLSPSERKQIAGFVSPAFADFLLVVELTGCRPFSEVGKLEAMHLDLGKGTATLEKHKTAEKTGLPRVIYFPKAALEVVRRKAEEHPTGPLFRTRRGSRWNAQNAWKWFHEIEKRLGIKAFSYAYRHTRITEALINGVPVEVVAELCGNTPQIIHSNYADVRANEAALRAAAEKAAG